MRQSGHESAVCSTVESKHGIQSVCRHGIVTGRMSTLRQTGQVAVAAVRRSSATAGAADGPARRRTIAATAAGAAPKKTDGRLRGHETVPVETGTAPTD